MRRYADWEVRLNQFCRERMSVPDQADFVSEAVRTITGESISTDNLASLQAVGIKLARRGDIVNVSDNYGIVSLDGMRALFPGEDGLIRVPVLSCDGAWRVG
jgi:hypothetical protein